MAQPRHGTLSNLSSLSAGKRTRGARIRSPVGDLLKLQGRRSGKLRRRAGVSEYPLSNALDDDPLPIAAFASTLLARHLVYQLAVSSALRTEVLGGTWRSGFRIIIRGVRPKWI